MPVGSGSRTVGRAVGKASGVGFGAPKHARGVVQGRVGDCTKMNVPSLVAVVLLLYTGLVGIPFTGRSWGVSPGGRGRPGISPK